MATITSYKVEDLRFPTSLSGDGTDASESRMLHEYADNVESSQFTLSNSVNKECDYSAAYVTLATSDGLEANGMSFTIGRSNDVSSSSRFRKPLWNLFSSPKSMLRLLELSHCHPSFKLKC